MNATLTMPMLLAVAVGGAAGSVARYLIGVLLWRSSAAFPLSTLLINVAGSFLIGLFTKLFHAPDDQPVLRVALIVGVCGGFTTFSTFSADTLALLQHGKTSRAALYVSISLFASLLATLAGFMVGRTAR